MAIQTWRGCTDIVPPLEGAGTKITAIPFIEASRGDWHFGGKGLVRYQTVVGGGLSLTIGIDYRDDGYQSDYGNDPGFSGYSSPREEIIAKLAASHGWLTANATQDISHRSESSTASLALEIPVDVRQKRLKININTTAHWYSRDYVHYHYGIEGQQIENSTGRIAYQGKAAVNYEAGLSGLYLINRRWIIIGSLSRTRLDDVITNSPLIEKRYQNKALMVFVYQL